jgi:hypothetical protein
MQAERINLEIVHSPKMQPTVEKKTVYPVAVEHITPRLKPVCPG